MQAQTLISKTRRSLWNGLIVGPKLVKNQRCLSEQAHKQLVDALTEHYFSDSRYYPEPPHVYLATRTGQADCAAHVLGRLTQFRSVVVPWLDSFIGLRKARILEIGCGTGASTISLGEQGAEVVGVDESDAALEVARVRSRLYGLNPCFVQANAIELTKAFGNSNFDAIIFFAVLEHMTWEERRTALRAAWEILKPGQHLVVIETPNRLWHTDHHTSGQPFFNWLPDELAFTYSRYTNREIYRDMFREMTPDASVRFARWGRGVSYHDFVISLDVPAEKLPVASYMQSFVRTRTLTLPLVRLSPSGRFEAVLQKLAPGVNRAFLCSDLYLALRKP